MKDAIKYFHMLTELQEENYIPYLYLSLANEYVYNKTGKKKFLKLAKKSIIKAAKLKPADDNVIEQVKNLGIVNKKEEQKL